MLKVAWDSAERFKNQKEPFCLPSEIKRIKFQQLHYWKQNLTVAT